MTNSAIPEIFSAELERQWSVFGPVADEYALTPHREAIVTVWAASPMAYELSRKHPDVVAELLVGCAIDTTHSMADLHSRYDDAISQCVSLQDLQHCLRVLRQREMLRIAWRDLSSVGELDEILSELTSLAEFCTDSALDWCHREAVARYGEPRDETGQTVHMVVLGMGKLGGGELNFSSDIDLIFAYSADGETDAEQPIANSQFFIRLGQKFIKALNEVTVDGFVFRVDVRLRPFGESGPLAISFEAMENYYTVHGRDWERYAMIKARGVAGDRQACEELLTSLRPFVYRRYLDFGAFDSLRKMKALIHKQVRRKRLEDNIKLGEGGIREIEFIGQVFQLIRGGREPELQVRGIQPVLHIIGREGLLPEYAISQLLEAYRFLRRVENRLQMVNDQQTHKLPSQHEARARLVLAMGYTDWDTFHADLQRHRRRVHDQFEQLVTAPQIDSVENNDDATTSELLDLWQGELDDDEARNVLINSGFSEPEKAIAALADLRASQTYQSKNSVARERMDRLMPMLLAALCQCDEPDIVLPRVLELIVSVLRRSVYLALLAEHPIALSQLVKLSAASPWIAAYLSRYPILLDNLMSPRELYAPLDRKQLDQALREELGHLTTEDMEFQMERLRGFKQSQTLRVAAADVMGVLPLMKVSDQLTWIAESILDYTLELVTQQMVSRHGEPCCVVNDEEVKASMAIVAYGKLGGIELGYGSDLDIIFLHDSQGTGATTRGEKAIDNEKFFVRLAQRIIHVLNAFTSGGKLYDVDTRLRPNGSSGLLVSGLQAFEHYQMNKAWTWEHQALVRARVISGSDSIRCAFDGIRRRVLMQSRDLHKLRTDVTRMREKMWQHGGGDKKPGFDIKKDPGGIADIEFMVQYSALAHAHRHAEVIEFTDNIRILDSLASCGLMPEDDVKALQTIYKYYRDRVHQLSLQEMSASVSSDEFAAERCEVRRIWEQFFASTGNKQDEK